MRYLDGKREADPDFSSLIWLRRCCTVKVKFSSAALKKQKEKWKKRAADKDTQQMGQRGALKINFIKYILNGGRIKLGGWHVKAEKRGEGRAGKCKCRKAEMWPMFQEEDLVPPKFMGIFCRIPWSQHFHLLAGGAMF